MALQESGEMYLETILILSQENSYVRAIDVGEYMGFSKPSVSRAMGVLKNGGYIQVGEDGHITLTDVGKETAEKIYTRHTVLTEMLVGLGVDHNTAAEDACKMEHVISDDTFQALRLHASEYQKDKRRN